MTNVIANPYTSADWNVLYPLGIVALGALAVLFVDLVSKKHAPKWLTLALAGLSVIGAGVVCAQQYGQNYDAFGGGFLLGGFAVVMQELVLVAALGTLALYATLGDEERMAGTIALLLWSTCGAMLMAGAANLMTIFLGLELLSLALYCLCGLRENAIAREAALKYLILSSTASGFLLYGMALLFGSTGSVALAAIAQAPVAGNPMLWIGCALFLVGLAFKLSLVPFHAWSPDVYEGAPLPVTAFMSVATKVGALAVLARFVDAAVPSAGAEKLLLPLWIIAGISMVAGNLGMLAQHDLKRLLAFSGIAQVGYIVAALAGGGALGLRYALFYLIAYTFMNLGAFAVATAISTQAEEGSRLANYHGLAQRRPFLAAAMTFFMLALAGMPPTAGFVGKILILSANVGAGYAWLAGLLILGTAISLYAYAKIIRAMYVRDEHAHAREAHPVSPLAWASAAVCAAVLLVLTFYPLAPSNVIPLVR